MKSNKKIIIIGLLVCLLVFGVALTKKSSNKKRSENQNLQTNKTPTDNLKVQAGWLLNGEFSNICSAIVNGYYAEENINVELIPGGPSGASFIIATNAIAQDPKLDIAVDGDMVPLLRGVTKENESERLKVKSFATFWNEVPYGFIVKDDSGLNSLKDFAKRKPDGSKYKIGVTADSVIQYAIADYIGIPVSDLNIVIVGFDATPFLTGQVDALAGYWTTQAYEVEKVGIKYKFLGVNEIPGFSQPSQVAIATDKTLREKKEVLTRWLRATNRGTEFVIANPEKAAEQITDERCGGKNFNVDQELWLIKKSIPLFVKNGDVSEDQMTSFSKAYYDLKQIPKIPSISEIYDSSIISNL
jgi:ABC-type nitrate/sulfonate/bicarbonate transport system substrate-binding protein